MTVSSHEFAATAPAVSSQQFAGYTVPADNQSGVATHRAPSITPITAAPAQPTPHHPHSIPAAHQLTPEQQQQVQLMQMGQRLAQEIHLLSGRLNDQQFAQIAQAMESHPVSQKIHQEMAETALASMMAAHLITKAHVVNPAVVTKALVDDAMNLVGDFKFGPRQENGIMALQQKFAELEVKYQLNNVQLHPASVAAASAATPPALQQQPAMAAAPMAANANNVIAAASSAQHMGKLGQLHHSLGA